MKKTIIFISMFVLIAAVSAACFGSSNGDDSSLNESVKSADTQEDSGAQESMESEGVSEAQEISDTLSSFDPSTMENQLSSFVLRDDDLPDDYRLPTGGESRRTTLVLINEMGELQAKRYVLATGRVNGWMIQLERERKDAFAPSAMESSIQLFETNDGAKLALSPEWYPAFQDGEPNWVDGGCDFGEECLFYQSSKTDPASQITTLRYDVAFVYRNVLIWVMGRGLDIDVTPEYILDAAGAIYDKLETYAPEQ